MTDLERMAREAGLPVERDSRHTGWWLAEFHSVDMVEAITKFADLIRADERERCATFCTPPHSYAMPDVVTGERFEKFMADLAAAIRN